MTREGRNCCQQIMDSNLDDLSSSLFWRAVGAEFLGTLLLVFLGCGSTLAFDDASKPTSLEVCMCFGFTVGTIVWCIAHVSGGHINPAVSFGMLAARKISFCRAILYTVAQCAGAIVGALILKTLTPEAARGSLGASLVPVKPLAIEPTTAFAAEIMMTFVLVFTVFATCDENRTDLKGSGPLAIGISVLVSAIFGGKYSGASLNPARSLGPNAVMGLWANQWVYWAGPIVGGILAALIYETFFAANSSAHKTKAFLLSSNYNSANFEAPQKSTRRSDDAQERDFIASDK